MPLLLLFKDWMLRSTLPMFPSRSFLSPGRICKSLMHPKLIFVYGVRQWSIISFLFFLLLCGCPVFRHHLLKRLSFLLRYCLFLCQVGVIHVFLGSQFRSIDPRLSVFLPIPCSFDYPRLSFLTLLPGQIYLLLSVLPTLKTPANF